MQTKVCRLRLMLEGANVKLALPKLFC